MFRIQTKACFCLACTVPLLLGLYRSGADDEASVASGQLIAMAQPPHLPDMPHAEFHPQYLPRSLTEVSGTTIWMDYSMPAEVTATTGA